MKLLKAMIVIVFLFTGVLTSCSISDDEIANPIENAETGGDEIDDPAEPDDDD